MTKRKKRWNVLCIGITACFSFCAAICFSQSIHTITDKKDILIGEQVQLKIKAVLPTNGDRLNKWISIPDSIPHFDIVEAGKVDTITYKDNSRAIEQTILFTSFDSGKWVFPSLPVEISNGTGKKENTLKTDSILINVSYSPPDSTNELRDIKPIIKVSVTDYTLYYIIGGIVLLLLVIVLLYWYWKKKKRSVPTAPGSKTDPYDEAMKEIKKLAQYDLQNADEVKMVHTQLSIIFKRYLGRKQGKDLLNRTTGDLLIRMREHSMAADHVSDLAMALRCTDAVKFAKYMPGVSESEDCIVKIKSIIQLINNKQ